MSPRACSVIGGHALPFPTISAGGARRAAAASPSVGAVAGAGHRATVSTVLRLSQARRLARA
eukprot:CAMPEP_0119385664 /NCGR_PEP_ID=MMETSP1334-20130426/92207_1 /TAXON_ID=127549 /ORGANISM="Calcidiscus leptoporus, Strain RCC1130" /LENGTH=61 /DNA_ID=CAMNT_0007406987 /DNA_START=86 /DNA_END=271 /DNA_ORIENTATION=-